MNWLFITKVLCVALSAALAGLLQEHVIPDNYIGIAGWLSGILAGAPLQIERFFGRVTVRKDDPRLEN